MLAHIHVILEALKKRQTYKAVYVEPRRIACEYCNDVFVYLVTGKVSVSVDAWRWEEDAVLARKGTKDLHAKVERATKAPRLGLALCPGCHWYQGWMVRRSRRGPLAILAIAGASIGLALGFVGMCLELHRDLAATEIWLPVGGAFAGLCLGASLAYLWGSIFGVSHGAHPHVEDPASIGDKAWLELVRASKPGHVRAWYQRLGRPLPKGAELYPLPLRDETATG
jgi:hypothetical protein